MKYRLGLDVGTNSIGWWCVGLDADGAPAASIGGGARVFSDGRNPKDGESLAIQRRTPRAMRRRRDRYLARRSDLMDALIATGLMPADEAERQALVRLDPYELRAKAVNGAAKPHELGRALFHLNQRRGFKSNRKTDEPDDKSKIQPRIIELKQRIERSGAKTLGEYLWNRRRRGKMVRARPEAGFYTDRSLYEHEFDKIREVQAPHQTLRPEQWDELRKIIFFQRNLRPVDPGWCLLEKGERRAHRALPCAQEFRMVQETNNLRILAPGEPAKPLTREQRDRVLKELRTRKKLELDTLLKLLKLPSGARINLLDENRKALKGDETAARMKEIFGKRWLDMPVAQRTEIVRKLIETEKPDEIERVAQDEWGLDETAAKKLSHTGLPDGYARLSEKAINKLLPVMEEQGLVYADAVAEIPEYGSHSDFRSSRALDRLPYYGAVLERQCVGGDPTKPKEDEVAHYGRLANPTVHIGLGQLRRLVNRLIETYGKPEEIVIELARELKMNKEEKDKERQKNLKNKEANERREKDIRAAGGAPTPHLLRKLRLWEEQKYGAENVCPFTGSPISFSMAINESTEIEHILPFSKTLDDSMANKVLCLREANRAKKDRSPYDAFHANPTIGGRTYNYEEIKMRADALPPNKRWRFYPDAMEKFADEAKFLDRQLNETKYLSRIARFYLSHLYNEKDEQRLRVRAIPGRLTAMLRGKWGLNALLSDHNRLGGDGDGDDRPRKNRDDHRHHAIDAFVIAMTDQRLLQRISAMNSDADRKRLIDQMPPPWEGFTPDILRPQLERLIVSHKPDHGTFPWMAKTKSAKGKSQTSGSLHNDTAYGLIAPGKNGSGNVVWRKSLASLLTPKDMDAWLPRVRDHALREALIAEWKTFKNAKPSATEKPLEESNRKKKNAAGLFAEHAARVGVQLNGRKVKVRRVRVTDDVGVVPIKERKTGKPYKAYRPDGNAFADIYQLPDGSWKTVIIRRFDANQPHYNPATERPHPAAKKLFRIQIDDLCAIYQNEERRIVRVCKLSTESGKEHVYLIDHNESNVDARVRDKELKYFKESASSLKKKGFRKVGVDEIGRVTDPGPRTGKTG